MMIFMVIFMIMIYRDYHDYHDDDDNGDGVHIKPSRLHEQGPLLLRLLQA